MSPNAKVRNVRAEADGNGVVSPSARPYMTGRHGVEYLNGGREKDLLRLESEKGAISRRLDAEKRGACAL